MIRIGPLDFAESHERNLVVDGDVLDGIIDSRDCTIRMERDLHPQQAFLTRWHEVVHELLGQAGRTETSDEGLVSTLSVGIVQVLRDNPSMRGDQLWP